MPRRSTSSTSSSTRSRFSSISRFLMSAMIVPRSSTRDLSCAFRAEVRSAWRRARSCVIRRNLMVPAPILPDRRVHLPLLPLARLLVVAVLAEVGENAGLLAFFLETPQCPIEVLIVVDDDFRQTGSPLRGVVSPVKWNEATILWSDLNQCQEMLRAGGA